MKFKVESISEICPTSGLSLEIDVDLTERQQELLLIELREYRGESWVLKQIKDDLDEEEWTKLLSEVNPSPEQKESE
jgi:hypothetical protein